VLKSYSLQPYIIIQPVLLLLLLLLLRHLLLLLCQGVHYGMFPGAGSPPTTVWTAIRPHNWRPSSSKEFLVELDMVTGEAIHSKNNS
jgi:hypothetical protein